MKKYLLRLVLIIIIAISISTAGSIYQKLTTNLDLISIMTFTGIQLVIFIAATILYISFRDRELLQDIKIKVSEQKIFNYLLVILLIVFVETFQDLLFLASDIPEIHYKSYRILLSQHVSILIFISVISLIGLLLIVWIKGIESIILKLTNLNNPAVWIPVLFFWLVLLIPSISRFGFKKNYLGLGMFLPTNTPILGIHVYVVVILSLIVWGIVNFLGKRLAGKNRKASLDIGISVILYLSALFIWVNAPLDPNPLLDEARPPNYETYPTSDALYYSIQADRVNVGEGFEETVEHPMYIMVLALMKLVAGPEIEGVILFKVVLFSFIPVLFYYLGKLTYSRYAGLLIGFLFILRERNSIQLSGVISGSNVKLIMTESVTLLCLLCFLLLVIKWTQSSSKNWNYPFLAGGVFGFVIMIRFEIISILPFLLIGTLPALHKQYRKLITGFLLFIVAFTIMITPWMIRNWQKTGLLYVDKYVVSLRIVEKISDYFRKDLQNDNGSNRMDEVEIVQLPVVNSNKDAQQILPDSFYSQQGLFPKSMYGDTNTDRFLNHLITNLEQVILYLPSNHQPLFTVGSLINTNAADAENHAARNGLFSDPYLERYVRSLPYWWPGWNSQLSMRSIIPVFISILLISIGIRSSLSKNMVITLILIATLLGYILAYSLYGRSGGRTIHSVDWITLVFYGIGIAEVLRFCSKEFYPSTFLNGFFLEPPLSNEYLQEEQDHSRLSVFMYGVLILFVGLSLPIYEEAVPQVYNQQEATQVQQTLLGDSFKFLEGIEPCLDSGQTQQDTLCMIYGKALYPRYFQAEERMEDDRQGKIPDYSFQRLEFYLTGTDNTWVAVPVSEFEDTLLNESDVLLIGTYQDGKMTNKIDRMYDRYFKVSFVFVLDPAGEEKISNVFTCGGPNCEGIP